MKFLIFSILAIFLNIPAISQEVGKKDMTMQINLRDLTFAKSYKLKESILLEFKLENTGREPVGVFAKLGLGYQGGIIIHILDDKGVEVDPPTLMHDSLDIDGMHDKRNYFELQSRQFFGVTHQFVVSELVSKPGAYKLIVEYHCPASSKYAMVDNFWGIEKKSITSGKIDLIVK